jgi:hypothetical protein
MKEHGGKMTTALATLLLACQLQVANAQSVPRVVWPGEHRTDVIGAGELPKNVMVLPGGTATTKKSDENWTTWTVTASVSTSASSAADKGGWQVVRLQDGKVLSFAEIAKLPQVQQDEVIGNMTGKDKIFYGRWYAQTANQEADRYAENRQAANHEEQRIDSNIQAANQRIETKKWVEQAAINRIIAQIPQVIPRYENDIALWQKIPLAEKQALEFALKVWEPKDWISRIKKILANPKNFA